MSEEPLTLPPIPPPKSSAEIQLLVSTLESLRSRSGISYDELAQRSRLEPGVIGKALRTEINQTRVSTLSHIASALGVKLILETHPIDHSEAPTHLAPQLEGS